ncbi:MAG: ATP-binding protein [Ginsengibacter sp.]
MAFKKFQNNLSKRPLRLIYIFYWFMLAYVVAALVFWFFALSQQNDELSSFKLQFLDVNDVSYSQKVQVIELEKSRKDAQYLGEGITFLLLIMAGAIFVFRIIKRQLIQSHQQQNFVMAITHELKTPISVTKLNLETMQKRKLDNEQQQRLIRSTIQEANRLNALCNNMLLLGQMDSGGYIITNELFDVGELSEECVGDFTIRFPQRKIYSDVEDSLLINGDKLLLQLALNNLLDNAIKYSDKEGVILLKGFRDGKFIKIKVIDDGKGIPDAEKSKIFEKYFRGAQRQTKGTGLGLYLTKKIVKQHHADISVTNNLPQGSIFEIKFKESKESLL